MGERVGIWFGVWFGNVDFIFLGFQEGTRSIILLSREENDVRNLRIWWLPRGIQSLSIILSCFVGEEREWKKDACAIFGKLVEVNKLLRVN